MRDDHRESLVHNPTGCPHDEIAALIETEPREIGGDRSAIMATVKLKCAKCETPFRFLGIDEGHSFRRPMVSQDHTTLFAPLVEGYNGTPAPVQVFEYTPAEAASAAREVEGNAK
jgi:hypothetical protein